VSGLQTQNNLLSTVLEHHKTEMAALKAAGKKDRDAVMLMEREVASLRDKLMTVCQDKEQLRSHLNTLQSDLGRVRDFTNTLQVGGL
jgi:chromosome segregation ATPase